MRYDSHSRTAIPLRAFDRPPQDATRALFSEQSLSAYHQGMQRCIDQVRRSLDRHRRPTSGVTPASLQPAFDAIDLDHPLATLDESLEELQRLYLDHAVHFHDPHYVAHLNCPITLPAILAEAIATPLNTAVETWDQSAGATLIEQKLIDWIAAQAGLGETADGVFTSGGTQSNLMALMIARDHACAALPGHTGNRHGGLPDAFRQLRILTSEVSHFSVQKAAALMGLGYDAVIPVPTDAERRMDVEALTTILAECERNGLKPFALVATAGTTDFGSIDPLLELAPICRARKLWLHVDAAYGGGLLLSSRYRHWLAGIEQADSVGIDFHKTFFQPVSCSACLVRERAHLGYVTHHADYLNPREQAEDGTPDLVNKSLQTTRRFDALKLWMTLRLQGAEALGGYLETVIALTRETHRALCQRDDFEVLMAPPLSTLLFRYAPAGTEGKATSEAEIEALNQDIRQALSQRGEAVIAATRVDGRLYLKFTLLNPLTRAQDLAALIERIAERGEALIAERSANEQGATEQGATERDVVDPHANAPRATEASPSGSPA
ncbi:pyridoxal phosphate-dependent decarboxylase family protein [Salinicola halophilus]|uniref:pyridoxal phosphate-dependent decarboxylase family protein n=1 Tax=Salinicola halophilus TaxID=184065 RepID=UPI000DA16D85|nr:aspartate aminotransferase family protein [Salinicola halophilus]